VEIEKIKLTQLISRMKGQKNKGLIQISEDSKTGDYIVIVGKGIHKEWGIFNLPQGLWQVRCSKAEVKEAVDKILDEKILS
jgi:hypothetical protein